MTKFILKHFLLLSVFERFQGIWLFFVEMISHFQILEYAELLTNFRELFHQMQIIF